MYSGYVFGLRIKGSGLGSSPGLAATISKIGYLLLQSRNMAKISLKQRKSLKQPTEPTVCSCTRYILSLSFDPIVFPKYFVHALFHTIVK